MTYQEKLKDPRWQKKRLEILQRDMWCCQICNNENDTLNIHHFQYRKGLEPWDYKDSDLLTVCEPCHAFITTHKIPECILKIWINNASKFDPSRLLESFDEFIGCVCANVRESIVGKSSS